MDNRILIACRSISKVTDDEIQEIDELAQLQMAHCKPLRNASTARVNALGRYNKAVIDKVRELRDLIHQGPGKGGCHG